MGIQGELLALQRKIESACKRSGRSAEEVALVLVTKQVDLEKIKEAYELGIRDFGENRVQEWFEKKDLLPADIRWHFIGHLQSNKARSCVGETHLIHSIDRAELALKLDELAKRKDVRVECLLQVNTSGELSKSGVKPEELPKVAEALRALKNLKIRGLMTIGPFTKDENEIRKSFRQLKTLRDEMKRRYSDADWHYLSMGMSSDFELAIEEGANLIRIGTAVFGERNL